ncbi:hypothetical protein F5I97DRAFT_1366733 [Phlebopus sp. FC_14]|nr:hypothetical protein F5I97DRAFT_1366733 [Phlebopus sp. FC_14]
MRPQTSASRPSSHRLAQTKWSKRPPILTNVTKSTVSSWTYAQPAQLQLCFLCSSVLTEYPSFVPNFAEGVSKIGTGDSISVGTPYAHFCHEFGNHHGTRGQSTVTALLDGCFATGKRRECSSSNLTIVVFQLLGHGSLREDLCNILFQWNAEETWKITPSHRAQDTCRGVLRETRFVRDPGRASSRLIPPRSPHRAQSFLTGESDADLLFSSRCHVGEVTFPRCFCAFPLLYANFNSVGTTI